MSTMTTYDKGQPSQPRIHVRTPYRIPAPTPIETALLAALQKK